MKHIFCVISAFFIFSSCTGLKTSKSDCQRLDRSFTYTISNTPIQKSNYSIKECFLNLLNKYRDDVDSVSFKIEGFEKLIVTYQGKFDAKPTVLEYQGKYKNKGYFEYY